MDSIYIYLESIKLVNIAINISVIFMLILLYKALKYKSLIFISIVYILDTISIVYFDLNNIYIYILLIISVIIKSKIIESKYKKYYKHKIFIISVMLLFLLISCFKFNLKYELYSTLYLSINLILIDFLIIRNLKKINNRLEISNRRIKSNNDILQKKHEELNEQFKLQNIYKDEIFKINDEVLNSIDKSENPIFILDTNKQYIDSNNKFNKIMNIKKGDDIDIISILKLKFINSAQLIENIYKINEKYEQNITIKSNTGELFKVNCYISTLNKKNLIIYVLTDITESTMIKNNLKESENRFKNLMDILNDGVIIHNGENIEYINNKALRLFGITNKSKIETTIGDLKNSVCDKYIKQLLNNMDLLNIEKEEISTIKIETNNKKILNITTTGINLNQTNMMLSIVIDISDLENTISQIEQREIMYKVLLKSMPEGIAIIDKNTKNHIYRNKQMIKILKNIGIDNFNKIVRLYTNKYKYSKFRRFKDVSEKIKELDLAIIDMNDENNLLVVVRTLDNKEKIEKLKELLDEVNENYRFKIEFLSDLVKNIKTPVETIYKYNNLIISESEKECKTDKYTRLIKQNCYRLTRLVNNILEVGSFENGSYKIELKKCDIVLLLKDIVQKTKSYTDEKGIKIRFESTLDSKIVVIDKDKIEKVVLNLISNAIKYTKKDGEIKISVKSNNGYTYISVKDTGVGIPNDKLDIIFKNFEQVDRTLTRGAEGTGIGLALVKNIIKAHEGEINVVSEVNKGSEFIITLNDNLYETTIDFGCNFSDFEKVDIEFSDIYFNYNN